MGDPFVVDHEHENYMNYGPSGCPDHFSSEQALRMRCWLTNKMSPWVEPNNRKDASAAISSNVPDLDNPLFACPAGDGDTWTVTLDFIDGYMANSMPAAQMSLELFANGAVEFEPAPILADMDATAANGFTTTFTVDNMAGCGSSWGKVSVAGSFVGLALFSANSPDYNADGHVNLSDLGNLAQSYNKCEGDVGYDACFDFTGDGCVNIAEVTLMSPHYGHSAP